MSKYRKKRKGPSQSAADALFRRALDLAAVGMSAAAATLPRHDDIEVTRSGEVRQSHKDGNKVDADSARRLDAFEALRDGMDTGAYDSARRLEKDILVSRDEHDRGRSLMRVDNDTAGDRTDAIISAKRRTLAVERLMGLRDWWLLNLLIAPTPNRFDHWRQVVAYVTGEEDRHSQGAAVRFACGNLHLAYEALEGRTRATRLDRATAGV